MTPDEYRNALKSLGGKYSEFQSSYGGENYEIEQRVKAFVQDTKGERLICYYLNRIGNCGVQTESEKNTEAIVKSAAAAEKSSHAAELSAASSVKAAEAARESAETTRSARNISYLAVIFTAIGLTLAGVSLYWTLTKP